MMSYALAMRNININHREIIPGNIPTYVLNEILKDKYNQKMIKKYVFHSNKNKKEVKFSKHILIQFI